MRAGGIVTFCRDSFCCRPHHVSENPFRHSILVVLRDVRPSASFAAGWQHCFSASLASYSPGNEGQHVAFLTVYSCFNGRYGFGAIYSSNRQATAGILVFLYTVTSCVCFVTAPCMQTATTEQCHCLPPQVVALQIGGSCGGITPNITGTKDAVEPENLIMPLVLLDSTPPVAPTAPPASCRDVQAQNGTNDGADRQCILTLGSGFAARKVTVFAPA